MKHAVMYSTLVEEKDLISKRQMASTLTPELLRLSSVSLTPLDYFTDSSGTFNVKSDLVLVVGKTKFYCHRLLLSLVSPVFTRMFDGEFKEHNADEIKLEGKTSESILELLKYIYPQFHGQITNDNLEDFLLLADEYMIEHLKQPCKDLLAKQLQCFHFALLPTKHKLEQPSTKSKNFHASDSALDSSHQQDDESSTHRPHPSRRPTSSARHHTIKSSSTYFKSADKNTSPSNIHPRYIVCLDKTQMPSFQSAHNTRVPFTTTDLELWLRRLRILYQIDKGRNYGEIIDSILSILQFVPATLLYTHITSVDEAMLNDIARSRMCMLEEWAADGDPCRLVSLTDSYQKMSPSVLINREPTSTNMINDERNSSHETIFSSSDSDGTAVAFEINTSDSD